MKYNISEDYDIVFLQEVQWAEKGIRKWLIPSEYNMAITLSEDKQTNSCILYRLEKQLLHLLADDPQVEEVTKALNAVFLIGSLNIPNVYV